MRIHTRFLAAVGSFSLVVATGASLFGQIDQTADYVAGRDLLANERPNDATDSANPNATVSNWSYGYRGTFADDGAPGFFVAGDHVDGPSYEGFQEPAPGTTLPLVFVNVSGAPILQPDGAVNPGEMLLHPDNSGNQASVFVRFTATIPGTYNVNALWEDTDDCCASGGVRVGITRGDSANTTFSELKNDVVSRGEGDAFGDSTTYSGQITLAVGDHLDFVTNRNTSYEGDATRFDASIDLVPEPTTGLALLGLAGLARRRRR